MPGTVTEWASGVTAAHPPKRCRRRAAAAFESSLVLSRVEWVRPELVAEVKNLTWTGNNLLR